MVEISGGCSIGIKLSLGRGKPKDHPSRYENVDFNYWASFKEEVQDDLSEDDKKEYAQKLIEMARNICEMNVDGDIEDITETKVFSNIN